MARLNRIRRLVVDREEAARIITKATLEQQLAELEAEIAADEVQVPSAPSSPPGPEALVSNGGMH